MNLLSKNNIIIIALISLLAIAGYIIYSLNIEFTPDMDGNITFLMLSKLWSLGFLFLIAIVIYLLRHSNIAPALSVFSVSAYFVVLYGILFISTEYGMNGHWGDNANRIAEICKMMAYGSFFQDWYLRDLPSFYPPLWFFIMAVYAWVLNIEAYQTVKFGYLLIFLVYPWLLYFSWKKIVSNSVAAAIVIGSIFITFKYLDWIYYEHITAGLFIPWWLYYFERSDESVITKKFNWKLYLYGGLCGALLFMTYYYWFFMAFFALPLTLMIRYNESKSVLTIWQDLKHKIILMAVVALLSAVYWLPLLRSIYWLGSDSMQNVWFGTRHTDLSREWGEISIESIIIFLGVFALVYFWDYFKKAKLLMLYMGGIVIILIDRIFNLTGSSFQSRKILEFVQLFAIVPAVVAVMFFLEHIKSNKKLWAGCLSVLMMVLIVSANTHTEIYQNQKYKIGIKQEVPLKDLAVFDAVEVANKVFLTNHYIEACYRPFYLFIPLNNMQAHSASRLSQREKFLDQAIKIKEPKILAYCFRYNRYSPIDYVYMPLNEASRTWELSIQKVEFNKSARAVKRVFSVNHFERPDIFVERHSAGLYELVVEDRNEATDSLIKELYPDIFWHLQVKK